MLHHIDVDDPTIEEIEEIDDHFKYQIFSEFLIGSFMIRALKEERYEEVVQLINEIKRRIADETLDDELFFSMCRDEHFTKHFDPKCFFE